jgi:hypothetical protein
MKRIALILAPPLALALLLRLHKKRARSSATVLGPHGLPVFRSRGHRITPEMVGKFQEDDAE